eukprot:EG_transcript_9442
MRCWLAVLLVLILTAIPLLKIPSNADTPTLHAPTGRLQPLKPKVRQDLVAGEGRVPARHTVDPLVSVHPETAAEDDGTALPVVQETVATSAADDGPSPDGGAPLGWSAMAVPAPDFDYGAALRRETGVRQLRWVLERALARGNVSRQRCLRAGQEPGYCLTAADLSPRSPMTSFHDFFRPSGTVAMPGDSQIGVQYPFISGSTFRAIADDHQETRTDYYWGYGGVKYRRYQFRVNLTAMTNRSLLYWNLNPTRNDLNVLHQLLMEEKRFVHHFFLISTNQDNFAYPDWLLEHPLLLKLFCINIPRNVSHPKLVPIPLGIHPMHARSSKELVFARGRSRTVNASTMAMLYARFRMKNHPWRRALTERLQGMFPNVPNSTEAGIRIRRAHFYGDVLRSRFVLSPPGNGIDTFRTWEAMYVGRVPIIDAQLPAFLHEDLPCLTVEDWNVITPAYLARKWDELSSNRRGYNLDKLWMPWWLVYVLRHCLIVP